MNIGDKYCKWTVIGVAPDRVDKAGRHHKRVVARCDCGTTIEKDVYKLKHGAKMCKQCYLQIASQNSIPFEHKTNTYKFCKDYGIGFASNTNSEYYFDANDYDKIKDICWHENSYGYIYGYDTKTKQRIPLHCLVMNAIDDTVNVVDHINRNPKDCRKSNLRLCSQGENAMNRSLYKNNTSGCNGVSFDKKSNKWVAYINKNTKRYRIGSFVDKDEAIRARKETEKEMFVQFCPT